MFGGIRKPDDWYQFEDTDDLDTLGKSNITSAQSVTMSYIVAEARLGDTVDETFYDGFEDRIIDVFAEWK